MRSLTVQIPQPCHERWSDMQPNERGRFCASCQKTVVDYTALSDQELVKLLNQASEGTCGQFRNEQLNRPFILPGTVPVWRRWIGLVTMSLFGWQTVQAQVIQPNSPTQQTSVRPDFAVTTLPARAPMGGSVTTMVVSGKVMRMDTSGNLSPAPMAYVIVRRPGSGGHIETDSTGSFKLTVSIPMEATTLEVRVSTKDRLLAYTTFEAIPSTTSIVLDDIILDEKRNIPVVITGGGIALIKSPTLWQKIKRKVFH